MSEKEINPTFNDIRESYGLPRIENKDKEIERLNNIINELEKWIKDKDKNALQDDNYWEVLDKLQELRRIYE